jgi:hypothetical protein
VSASPKSFLAVLPALVAGILLLLFATSGTKLECERASHACTWREGFFGGDEFSFQISEVREVKFVGDRGKHGNDGQVELYVGSHDALVFGKGESEAVAQSMAERAQSFFAGTGAALSFQTPSRSWMFFLGGGFLVGALAMIVSRARPQKGTLLAPFAVFVAVLAVGGAVTTCVRRDDPGLSVSG